MTSAEARARIEDGTQWQSAPALSTEEVDRLLARATALGLTEDAVRGVIADGWRQKAGKAKFDVKAGSTEAKRMQMADLALKMAAQYDPTLAIGSGAGSMELGYTARKTIDEFGLVDWV